MNSNLEKTEKTRKIVKNTQTHGERTHTTNPNEQFTNIQESHWILPFGIHRSYILCRRSYNNKIIICKQWQPTVAQTLTILTAQKHNRN